MQVLVTGGAGFVGSHLVKMLCQAGHQVRVLVRPTTNRANLQGVPCSFAEGDLRQPDQLAQAVAGCERVFHCAADYRLWAPDPEDLYRTNVQGTKNLLLACRQAGTARVVVTSSVATVGIPSDGTPGNEDTPVTLENMVGHYKRSKFLEEQAAREFAAQGDPIVIVNPSTPVGSGDLRPTATGKIITEFLKGRMPAFVITSLNIVEVDDVCRGHLLAADKGVPGRRYILGGSDCTLKNIFDMLSEISGRPAPTVELPLWVAYIAGAVDTFFSTKICRREPRVPLEGVKMARKHMYFSSQRAKDELGYVPAFTPSQALRRAVEWFVENDYVPSLPKMKK